MGYVIGTGTLCGRELHLTKHLRRCTGDGFSHSFAYSFTQGCSPANKNAE